MLLHQLSDEDLVQRIKFPASKTEFEEAFWELHDRCKDDIERVARRRSRGSIQDADLSDVAQMVWMTVVRDLELYDSRRPFRPWFRTIVGRRQCDNYRKLARDHRHTQRLDDVDELRSPNDDIADFDFANLIKHALAALDPDLRKYFDAYVECDGDATQVADQMSVAPCTARRKRHELRQHFAA